MPTSRFIPASPRKYLFPAVVCLGFVVLGIWLIVVSYRERGELELDWEGAIPLLTLLFFGAGAVTLLRKMYLVRGNGLLIEDAGITDTVTGFQSVFIPWEHIGGFRLWSLAGTHMALVEMIDSEAFIATLPREFQRKTARLSVKTHRAPIGINVGMLKMKRKEVLALLEASLANYRALPEAERPGHHHGPAT